MTDLDAYVAKVRAEPFAVLRGAARLFEGELAGRMRAAALAEGELWRARAPRDLVLGAPAELSAVSQDIERLMRRAPRRAFAAMELAEELGAVRNTICDNLGRLVRDGVVMCVTPEGRKPKRYRLAPRAGGEDADG